MTDHGIATLLVIGGRWEGLCRCGAALSGAGGPDEALAAFDDHAGVRIIVGLVKVR